MRFFNFIACSVFLASQAAAFHLYIDSGDTKCISKDIGHETLVVGHYRTEEYNTNINAWSPNNDITVKITVDDDTHRIVNRQGKAMGDFTFTSTSSGRHTICYTASFNEWYGYHRIRLSMDLLVGHQGVSPVENKDYKLHDMSWQLQELKGRVEDVKREQGYQFEREVRFRNLSERANERVVWWSLLQVVVLATTVWWQLRHLRGFFVAKKLV